MNIAAIDAFVNKLFEEIETRIPGFRNSEPDWSISEGNVAICIITDAGKLYGKVYGTDKIKQRQFFKVAYQKASQVWITGYKTGEYESIVFGGGMDPEDSPIELPDLIGWVGGQPIQLDEETKLAVGFSGFRGFNDIEIVRKAVAGITF
jgi:glc operon protein GlcG